MKNLNVFCLVINMLAFSACVQNVDSEAARTAISEAGIALTDALNTDDVDGILAGLTEDHLTMAPNEATLDMSNLRAWHQDRFVEELSGFLLLMAISQSDAQGACGKRVIRIDLNGRFEPADRVIMPLGE